MKKFLSVVSISVLLLTFTGTASASAAEPKSGKFEITTLDQFLEEVKSKKAKDSKELSKSKSSNSKSFKSKLTTEEVELLNSTDPKVREEYANLLEADLNSFDFSNEDLVANQPYELGESGAILTITTETTENTDMVSGLNDFVTLASTSSTQYIYRAHRSTPYAYQINYNITAYAYPDSITGLLTNYTVKSDGLRLTTASTAGTRSIFPTAIQASASITDARAEKLGYDINAQGDYKVTIGGYNGIGLVSFDMTLTSRVLWHGTNASGITVGQSYTENGDQSPW